MSPLRLLWLALAVWGALHPTARSLAWLRDNGGGIGGLIRAWQANAATSGLVWDLAIAALALICWILAETYVRKNWEALLAIPATLLLGPGCGLPFYLFLRARPIR